MTRHFRSRFARKPSSLVLPSIKTTAQRLHPPSVRVETTAAEPDILDRGIETANNVAFSRYLYYDGELSILIYEVPKGRTIPAQRPRHLGSALGLSWTAAARRLCARRRRPGARVADLASRTMPCSSAAISRSSRRPRTSQLHGAREGTYGVTS